jgi:hypothetical protein
MQEFYDQLFSAEGGKESSKDWKHQLTQAELEDLDVVVAQTRSWQDWE